MNKKLFWIILIAILLVGAVLGYAGYKYYQKKIIATGYPASCPPGCYCSEREGAGICLGSGNCGGTCMLRKVKIK